ncbi:MAG: hypothetical protein KDD55_01425 [Bdellovibrionales bacterium]|nr:hypothetical protein [Bdellovibrionales bacterium]
MPDPLENAQQNTVRSISAIEALSSVSSIHGAKAVRLRELVEKGFEVPPAVALAGGAMRRLNDPVAFAADLNRVLMAFFSDELLMVRSSGLNEDGVMRSAAGKYESFDSVPNEIHAILGAAKKITESSDHPESMGILIQRQVRAKVAGVAFSDVSGGLGNDGVLVEAVVGHAGELCGGEASGSLLYQPSSESQFEMQGTASTGEMFSKGLQSELIQTVRRVREAFNFPVDVEWVVDDADKIWLVQVRPITAPVIAPAMEDRGYPGIGVSPGEAQATACVIGGLYQFDPEPGEIIVARTLDSRGVERMRQAAGLIMEVGGLLSHPAIVAREMGIPCIVGVTHATERIRQGASVTMNGATGDVIVNGERLLPLSTHIHRSTPVPFEDLREQKLSGGYLVLRDSNGKILLPITFTSIELEWLQDTRDAREGLLAADFTQTTQYDEYFNWKRYQDIPVLNQLHDQIIATAESLDLSAGVELVARVREALPNFLKFENATAAEKFVIDEMAMGIFRTVGTYLPEYYGAISVGRTLKPFADSIHSSVPSLMMMDQEVVERTLPPEIANALRFSHWLGEIRDSLFSEFRRANVLDNEFFTKRARGALICCNKLEITPPSKGEFDPLSELAPWQRALIDAVYSNPSFRSACGTLFKRVIPSLHL